MEKHSKSHISTFTILFFLMTGCGDLPYDVHLKNKFYLVGHEKSALDLGYDIGSGDYAVLLPETVTDFGFNEKYLIVKTKKTASYYIFDLSQKYDKKNLSSFRLGPFSESNYKGFLKNMQFNIPLKNIGDLE